jgi:transcriptional regulator with XRE-family HTH domain
VGDGVPNRSKAREQAFGRRLQDRRLKRGLSQEELAHQSGLHRTYISQIERGLKSPSLATIHAIASALGADAGTLISALIPERSALRS